MCIFRGGQVKSRGIADDDDEDDDGDDDDEDDCVFSEGDRIKAEEWLRSKISEKAVLSFIYTWDREPSDKKRGI